MSSRGRGESVVDFAVSNNNKLKYITELKDQKFRLTVKIQTQIKNTTDTPKIS